MDSESHTRNVSRWLEKEASFGEERFDVTKNALLDAIKSHRFKITNCIDHGDSFSIKAIFGSKLKAFFVGLIPLIGKHFLSGKRLLLQAHLHSGSAVRLNIKITPYMELFGSEEVGLVTQSLDEKASDEYVAARKIHEILKAIHSQLKLPLPEKLSHFDVKSFAKDTFLSMLIYPLDGYNAVKRVHIPPEVGSWCWGGFIIPEFWFAWHEIWGASVLCTLPTAALLQLMRFDALPHVQYILIAVALIIRFILGRTGNQIYFMRYGYYPTDKAKQKTFIVPADGPSWHWGAFLLPEFWFLWNEMWNVGMTALILDILLLFACWFTFSKTVLTVGLILLIVVRGVLGLKGNDLFFERYGYFPKDKNKMRQKA